MMMMAAPALWDAAHICLLLPPPVTGNRCMDETNASWAELQRVPLRAEDSPEEPPAGNVQSRYIACDVGYRWRALRARAQRVPGLLQVRLTTWQRCLGADACPINVK